MYQQALLIAISNHSDSNQWSTVTGLFYYFIILVF